MKNKQNFKSKIFLTGFMGSGKTSLGMLLSKKMKLQFVDLDKVIEKDTDKKISTLFLLYKEKGFRKIETETLKKICAVKKPLIIATGGGIVTRKVNIKLMKKNGIIVFLKVSPETVLKRLKNAVDRPLLYNLSYREKLKRIKKLLKKREKFYSQNHIEVNNDKDLKKTANEIKKKVLDFFKLQS